MLETFDVSNVKPEEPYPYEMRVGWSVDETTLRLGESLYGFAYCNNGKKANSNIFTKIGPSFNTGDVVTCLMDFDNMQINFLLNGKFVLENCLAVFDLPQEFKNNDNVVPFFPHVCVKNVKFQINFGHSETPWFQLPEGFLFADVVPYEYRYKGTLPPASKAKCTVLCLIGLPGSGKTTWVRQFLQSQTDVRWTVLGTNTVLEQMKVQGESRKKRHQGRWDLMLGVVVKCLNRLLTLACRMRKNYIIDMTNVYPLPRRKKMTPFKDYRKKAIVIVPTVEDYANRCLQQMRHEGKQMPSDAMLEMKACFTLPKEDEDVFDEIEFVELQRDEAQKVVDYFNEEGKAFKPRERKRRGDWQQEELPPKQSKTAPGAPPTTTKSQIGPANKPTISKSNPSYPYGVYHSLRPYSKLLFRLNTLPVVSSRTSSSRLASTSTFTRQWSTALGSVANGSSSTSQVSNWSQMRGTTSSGYTPRAGWPSAWPQASWKVTVPSTSQQSTPPASAATTNGCQFSFPPPTTST